MDKKPLIVVSICAVVLLVLGSLSNVVGYQTSHVSNNVEIDVTLNSEINQLSDPECDCEKNEPPTRPILCGLLSPLHSILDVLSHISIISAFFNDMLNVIGLFLGCSWAPGVPPE
ncbi:MAG TPA: hypothetical protein VN377_06950 [Candidatus Thermoplasmatota archaeon]|nr:hypothetical protein [Candidatus Thermoplasmatota archaeon]